MVFTLAIMMTSLVSVAQDLIKHHILKSEHLSESRTIFISLPPDYDSNNKTYPVLYVLDGEYIFDYIKGTVDFLTNDFNYLPEMIIVGIPNTNRDRDLYVSLKENGGYMLFIDFLEHELFKFVEKNYRVNHFRILYGWSSGSGICNYILTKRPQLIDGYILTGCGIGPNTEKFIKNNIPHAFSKKKYLYVNAEGEEPRKSGLLRYKNLLSDIDPKGLNKKFEIIEGSNHVDVMAEGAYSGLKYIFSSFFVPHHIKIKGYQAVLEYYDKVKKDYGVDFTIPIGAINETAGFYAQQNKSDDALHLLNYGISKYPESTALYGSLGELHQSLANISLAKKYYKIAMEKSTENISDYLKYEILLKELSQ